MTCRPSQSVSECFQLAQLDPDQYPAPVDLTRADLAAPQRGARYNTERSADNRRNRRWQQLAVGSLQHQG